MAFLPFLGAGLSAIGGLVGENQQQQSYKQL